MSLVTPALRVACCGLLVTLASAWGTSRAHASNPAEHVTEVLTPAGWELFGVYCGELDDLPSSPELRTPNGWEERVTREEPRWTGYACSEVVVPIEWLDLRS